MKRYRILWLDDDFQPLFDSPTPDQEDINDTREALQYDASKASKYGLEIDRISDFKQFNEKLESVAEYDAVILDLMGLDNQNIDNYEVAADAVERVQENNVIAYVYSANVTEGDIATMFKIPLRKFSASGRCFDKGHIHAHQSPGEHDTGNPFRGRELRGDQRSRHFKEQIADEENPGAHAEDFRCQPGHILGHGQFGISHIDSVNAGNNGYQKHRQNDAPVPFAF